MHSNLKSNGVLPLTNQDYEDFKKMESNGYTKFFNDGDIKEIILNVIIFKEMKNGEKTCPVIQLYLVRETVDLITLRPTKDIGGWFLCFNIHHFDHTDLPLLEKIFVEGICEKFKHDLNQRACGNYNVFNVMLSTYEVKCVNKKITDQQYPFSMDEFKQLLMNMFSQHRVALTKYFAVSTYHSTNEQLQAQVRILTFQLQQEQAKVKFLEDELASRK